MRREDVKPGMVVELKRDLANPEVDKRVARDLARLPMWPIGTLFLVKDFDYLALCSSRGDIPASHRGFDALVEACEEAPRTYDTVMFRLNGASRYLDYSGDILIELFKAGKVTLEDIEGAYNTYQAKGDDES